MSLEDYFKHIKKTEEDMRKEWKGEAEKRVKVQFVLSEIAQKEKIEAPVDETDAQVRQILEYHKNADPERARAYVENLLINEKVFEFLEEIRE